MLLQRQEAPDRIIHGPAVVCITHGDVYLQLLAVPQAKQWDGGLNPRPVDHLGPPKNEAEPAEIWGN